MSHVCIKPLGIDPSVDITSVFETFSQKEGAILLDSCTNTHPDGRFDIIVAEPVRSISVKDRSLKLIDHVKEQILPIDTKHSRDLPELVEQQLLQLFGNQELDTELPFVVGAMGYFSYDWGRTLEKLPSIAENEYQSDELKLGIYSWSIIRDKSNRKYYFCYHDKFPKPEIESIQQNRTRQLNRFYLASDWLSNLSKSEYKNKLSQIHEYLLAGDCYQVNMAQRFFAYYKGSEWQAYKMLREANNAPFSAYINTSSGAIISISPERFLSVKDDRVQSKPIKGTRPRMRDLAKDQLMSEQLLHSEKDRAENLMIVDLLRNDLSRNCQPGTVKVPQLFSIESFPAVHHLVSTVTGELKAGHSPLALLRDAFPGGSITGAPKIRAMEIIEELEPHRRHIYCGTIGYLGIQGDMDSNICIRTLLLEAGNIYCWAGGGIVADSDAESEYQETLDKVSKILPLLASSERETGT